MLTNFFPAPPYSIPSNATGWSYCSTVSGGLTGTGPASAVTTPGTAQFTYVTGVQAMNSSLTVNTEFIVKIGSTQVFRGYAQAAGGGVAAAFWPPLKSSAVNMGVTVETNVATPGSGLLVNLQGFTA